MSVKLFVILATILAVTNAAVIIKSEPLEIPSPVVIEDVVTGPGLVRPALRSEPEALTPADTVAAKHVAVEKIFPLVQRTPFPFLPHVLNEELFYSDFYDW